MAKKGGRLGWLLLIVLGIGWCSNQETPSTRAPSDLVVQQRAVEQKPPPPRSPQAERRDDPDRRSSILYSLLKPDPPTERQPAPASPAEIQQSGEQSERVLYTTANVRLRNGPSTDADVIWTVPSGTKVQSQGTDGAWHFVAVATYRGWMHGDYLRDQPAAAPAPLISVPARSRSGEPVRAARSGRCECPYDRDSRGRSCGARSAYSRGGGRRPVCFHR